MKLRPNTFHKFDFQNSRSTLSNQPNLYFTNWKNKSLRSRNLIQPSIQAYRHTRKICKKSFISFGSSNKAEMKALSVILLRSIIIKRKNQKDLAKLKSLLFDKKTVDQQGTLSENHILQIQSFIQIYEKFAFYQQGKEQYDKQQQKKILSNSQPLTYIAKLLKAYLDSKMGYHNQISEQMAVYIMYKMVCEEFQFQYYFTTGFYFFMSEKMFISTHDNEEYCLGQHEDYFNPLDMDDQFTLMASIPQEQVSFMNEKLDKSPYLEQDKHIKSNILINGNITIEDSFKNICQFTVPKTLNGRIRIKSKNKSSDHIGFQAYKKPKELLIFSKQSISPKFSNFEDRTSQLPHKFLKMKSNSNSSSQQIKIIHQQSCSEISKYKDQLKQPQSAIEKKAHSNYQTVKKTKIKINSIDEQGDFLQTIQKTKQKSHYCDCFSVKKSKNKMVSNNIEFQINPMKLQISKIKSQKKVEIEPSLKKMFQLSSNMSLSQYQMIFKKKKQNSSISQQISALSSKRQVKSNELTFLKEKKKYRKSCHEQGNTREQAQCSNQKSLNEVSSPIQKNSVREYFKERFSEKRENKLVSNDNYPKIQLLDSLGKTKLYKKQ